MRRVFDAFRQWMLRRALLDEERTVLNVVREKYPAHPRDVIFFVEEKKPLLPVRSSALIQVWGQNGEGPWVHLTNLAGFMRDGMTLDEIKRTQI
jgi:hypothetical protein